MPCAHPPKCAASITATVRASSCKAVQHGRANFSPVKLTIATRTSWYDPDVGKRTQIIGIVALVLVAGLLACGYLRHYRQRDALRREWLEFEHRRWLDSLDNSNTD